MSQSEDVNAPDYAPALQGVVTAVGISVNTVHGPEVNARLEAASSAEVMRCLEEGITTEEKNSWVIRERMAEARAREMELIIAEANEKAAAGGNE